MNSRRYSWQRLAVGAASVLVTSCSAIDGGESDSTESRGSQWGEGLGAQEAAGFMKVDVPAGAQEVKGAVQVNPQEDIYLLSFVTDEKAAVQIAEDLRPEQPLRTRNYDLPPTDELFGHLGIAEPQTQKGIRWAGVCPPCVSDGRREKVSWIEIYLHSQPQGKARVYLQAF